MAVLVTVLFFDEKWSVFVDEFHDVSERETPELIRALSSTG